MANHKVNYIVWHTAAHGANGRDYDTTVDQIRQWHKDRGWKDIGYHFVIRKDGTIQRGRKLDDDSVLEPDEIGAHVYGLNSQSVGICFSGHGDISPHTPEQRVAGLKLTKKLMEQFGVPVENVIGHREINKLVDRGLFPKEYRTSKTCPGRLVDMDEVREQLRKDSFPTPLKDKVDEKTATKLYNAFRDIYAIAQELHLSTDVLETLNNLRKLPEIDEIIALAKR